MNINNSDVSSTESIANLEANLNFEKSQNRHNLFDYRYWLGLIIAKGGKKNSQINTIKYAKLSNKKYDYIHIVQY